MTDIQIELETVTHAYRTKAGPLPVLDALTLSIPRNSFVRSWGRRDAGNPR